MYSINEINDTMQLNDIIYILTTSNNFFFLSKLYRKHRKVCDCINILFYSFLSLFNPVRLSRLLYRTYEHHPHFDLIQVVQKKKKFLLNQCDIVVRFCSLLQLVVRLQFSKNCLQRFKISFWYWIVFEFSTFQVKVFDCFHV